MPQGDKDKNDQFSVLNDIKVTKGQIYISKYMPWGIATILMWKVS